MATSYAPNIVSDGIVACWDAAGKRSYPGTGTTWTDLAGSNNGTLENGPTFSSDNGGSIVFDGSDDEIVCGNGDFIEGLTEITACCWVLVEDAGSSAYPRLIAKSFSGDFDLWAYRNDSTIGVWIGDSGYMMAPEDTITLGQWFYAVARFKSGETNGNQLWVNGVKVDEETKTATIGTSSTGLTLGNGNSQARPLSGKMASASIYNRALTAAEILQNYNATKWRFQ